MLRRVFLVVPLVLLALPVVAQKPQPLQRHLPAHPSLQGSVFLRLPDESHRQELIRRAYFRLEERMQQAGSDLEFQLTDLRTAFPHEFGGIRFADVITPKGGWSLRWNHQKHSVNGDLLGVSYRPEWYEARPWATAPEALAILERATIEEWLVNNASPRSAAREMITAAAITFYTVTATMEDRSRTYQAAVLWLPSPDEKSDCHLTFMDMITPYLNAALAEALPEPKTRAWLDAEMEARLAADAEKAVGASCVESTELISAAGETVGTTNHKLGSHAAIVGIEVNCSCESTCSARCDVQIVREECDDWGDIGDTHGWIHVMSVPSPDTKQEVLANGIVQGPTCYGGVACGWRQCWLSCGLQPTISASYSGITFEVTFLSAGAASIKKSINVVCSACETSDFDPTDPGGGGSQPTCPTPDSCSSPILIHLGQGQPRLSDIAAGVSFDIDADGALEEVAWPVSGAETAFLAMDRNGNGVIDDATELFGEHTSDQIDGLQEPNGYYALMGLDSASEERRVARGTLDGKIQQDEGPFVPLLLWFDRNRDGRSQPEELEELADRAISWIGYQFKTSRRRDRHGNVFRYRSDLGFTDSSRRGHSFDVFLLKQDP